MEDQIGLQAVRVMYLTGPAPGPAGHQIAHFEHFVENDMNSMLGHMPPVNASAVRRDKDNGRYQIIFQRAAVNRPLWHEVSDDGNIRPMLPNEARINNVTYGSHIMMDVALQRVDIETEEVTCIEEKRIPFGVLPIMVGSRYCYTHKMSDDAKALHQECTIDEGGYFIIGGLEKVIMGQERIAHNSIFVSLVDHPQSPYTHKAEIRCVPLNGRNAHRTSNTAICITKLHNGGQTVQGIDNARTESIRVILPHLAKSRLPIIILFRALGCPPEQYRHYLQSLPAEMYAFCASEAAVALENSHGFLNYANATQQTVALEYIGRLLVPTGGNVREKYLLRAREVITYELLPHIGMDFTQVCNDEKLSFLAHMVKKVYNVFDGKAKEDCRDHLAHKRVELASSLLCSVYKNAMDRAMKQIGMMLFRAVDNRHRPLTIRHIVEPAALHITSAFRFAISSGRWGDADMNRLYGNEVRIGITQPLNRFMPLAMLSHVRKINTPMGREANVTNLSSPRQLHYSQWGKSPFFYSA